MRERRVGIIMNGVTGRMGLNQHLIRSILAIRKQGGVQLDDGSALMPDPILVGRNEEKLKAIADEHGLTRWSTDLKRALDNRGGHDLFRLRRDRAARAECAAGDRGGKACLLREAAGDDARERNEHGARCAEGRREAWRGAGQAVSAGHSQAAQVDRLRDFSGAFFPCAATLATGCLKATDQAPQRPSWNYKKEEDGGIILDMFCHWRYVLDHTFGAVKAVSCTGDDAYPGARGRGRQDLQMHRRRCGVWHV